MPDINIGWWNLENLFDRDNDPNRDPVLAKRLRKELAGWTATIRNAKLNQLASIIELMFGGSGPDLLGVCEVEDEEVLQLLVDRINIPNRNYRVVGHQSPDARGIDVSFIFDANTLGFDPTTGAGHRVVIKRSATRDLFWAEFDVLATGAIFVAIANHWPSRTAGKYESAPYRMLTGETLSFTLEEIFEQFEVGNNIPIILMGDFNDGPFDRSMQEYLLGTRDRGRVTRARNPLVLNLMWSLMTEKNPGTYRYKSDWNMLDQFLVTKGMLLNSSRVKIQRDSVAIFRPPIMLGSAGAPRRFGRPNKGLDLQGYSDHFPITVIARSPNP